MKNEMVIKTYDIDYSFIVKNYLDKELWQKEWTIFVYKEFVFTLNLYEINVKNDSITFEVNIKSPRDKSSTFFYYYRKQSNINILKKQINGAIFQLIEWSENSLIRDEEDYKRILNAESDEIDMLTSVAEEFLDREGVTNSEIRDVYIDNYISQNKKTSIWLSNYLDGRKYCILSDLYLTYTKITSDTTRYNRVLSKIKNNANYMEILKEVNVYIDKLNNEEKQEELKEEFRECLDAI